MQEEKLTFTLVLLELHHQEQLSYHNLRKVDKEISLLQGMQSLVKLIKVLALA